ncbi:hypothetical protein F4780DRAFT_781000 [Xylariomycetidae sp. FL0641]|nr:hypothetical protein F4780DRAFT_781000 [Xylariomycetidae sp. FL0641]
MADETSLHAQSTGELLATLKELFETGKYADLRVLCGDDDHWVHQSVVCPRSKRFAELVLTADKCEDAEGPGEVIVLKDEDPKTVRLMLHYLYYLDYPSSTSSSSPPPPATNGTNGNGPSIPARSSSIEYSIEKEAFADATSPSPGDEPTTSTTSTSTPTSSKRKNKKKPRNASNASNGVVAAVPATPASTAGAPTPAGSSVFASPPPPASSSSSQQQTTTTTLTQHAHLHALAHRFRIPGLARLASARFAAALGGGRWSAGDLATAARAAYSSPSPSSPSSSREHREREEEEEGLRGAVLGALAARPGLLEQEGGAVREVVRGTAELSFDLLMRVRKGGGGSGGGDGGCGGGGGESNWDGH